MRNFLAFRTMLTPLLIQTAFWAGLVICLAAGIYTLVQQHNIVRGLEVLIIGPVMVRILCESFILFFRMHETLVDINNKLVK